MSTDRPTAEDSVGHPPETERPGYVASLDGIRALAVTAVFLFHVTSTFQPGGFLGVSTFFTLSGFLITSLLLTERDETGDNDVIGFWGRRVRRLAPAAILNVMLILVLTVTVTNTWPRTGMGGDTVSIFANVFNWRLIAQGSESVIRFLSPFSPQWSLAVEEQFYIVMPLVLLAVFAVINRIRGRRAVHHRRVIALVCLVGVAISISASLLVAPAATFGIAVSPMELYRTDVRMGEILVGSLLAVAIPTWRVPHRAFADLIGWLGLVATLLLWRVAREDQWWLSHGGLPAVGIVSAALVYGALARGSLARVLGARPLVYIGTLSYGIYLYHWPIFLASRDLPFAERPVAMFAARVALTLAAAMLSFHLVEKPIRDRRLLTGRAGTAAWGASVVTACVLAFVVAS